MPGTRLFFVACLVVLFVAVALLASELLTAHSMPAEAVAGWNAWRDNRCEACHTLYGQGGPFAPDLTHITSQRSADYLRDFLVNPAAFHPGERAMPRFGLTRVETDSLLAFFTWVEQQVAAQVWPPAGTNAIIDNVAAVAEGELSDDPIERGRYWFSRPPAICSTCHSLEPDVVVVGPSLAGIAGRAAERVPNLAAEAYLRQSILDPSAYVVSGFPNVMMPNLGEQLSTDQINDLLAFLLTLE